ncbi:hypothetical protein GCM10022279_23620 [Comamonas faecalis]|uniref:Phasin family protein n=1 Tax=Comamonas faecalis TaxID=1387849 RepID=A0ABP7RLC2_9BURK
MSDTSPFGFGRFVPGFDFLQNLAKGGAAAMPPLAGWVAPTMSIEELDKRVQELKTVQFWLEQNARALGATVQAMQVQRMTLAALQDMNVAAGDMASAFGARMTEAGAAAQEPAGDKAPEAAGAGLPGADALQWWNALTQQFQQIASNALQDAGVQQAAFDATREMASGALKAATEMASHLGAAAQADAPAAGKTGAKKAAAGKTAAKKAASTAARKRSRPAS